MACPKCGHKHFYAHQRCYVEVIVDDQNDVLGEADTYPTCIYEAESPYGPYVCTNCGTAYEELPRLYEERSW